jgi:two-component system cell cycle sensor histidine kinase/response regulator CckA
MSLSDPRRFERLPVPRATPFHLAPAYAAWASGGVATVLFVEDEEDLREALAESLQDAGFSVWLAGSAREALQIAERLPFPLDALITDVVLPDMRGPELAARLTARRPGLPVIYTTGHHQHIKRPAHAAGMPSGSPYLEKPFPARDLTDLVYKAVSHQRRVGQN